MTRRQETTAQPLHLQLYLVESLLLSERCDALLKVLC